MSVKRINDPPLDNTSEMLKQLFAIINLDDRAMFLTPPGDGSKVIQRVRVMISRKRNDLKKRQAKLKYFKIHHSIHKYTDASGKRHDCVVVWRSRNLRHIMAETLEDLGV